jgi:hypothetical protein
MVGSGARIRDQLRSDSTSRVPPTSANLSRISARPIPPARPARNCSRTFWDSFVFPKRQCLLQFPIFLAYIWRGAYGWLLATAYTVATGRADEFFIRWRENLCCRQGDIFGSIALCWGHCPHDGIEYAPAVLSYWPTAIYGPREIQLREGLRFTHR